MPAWSLGDRRVTFASDQWWMAHNATVVGSARIGHQANLWFNVVVRSDNEIIDIGERVNVQDGSVLHADPGFPLTLGRRVTVGHKAMLHGCTVGDGALVGIEVEEVFMLIDLEPFEAAIAYGTLRAMLHAPVEHARCTPRGITEHRH